MEAGEKAEHDREWLVELTRPYSPTTTEKVERWHQTPAHNAIGFSAYCPIMASVRFFRWRPTRAPPPEEPCLRDQWLTGRTRRAGLAAALPTAAAESRILSSSHALTAIISAASR